MTAKSLAKPYQPTDALISGEAPPSPRILVVDDDPNICHANAIILIRHGYEVDVSENGAAAWEALQRFHYDLLVTDNQMPKMSGLELLYKLHATQFHLPVILASGSIPTDELSRQPWLNIEAILPKPYTFEALLGAVNIVLSQIVSVAETFDIPPAHWEQWRRSEAKPSAIRNHYVH